MENPKRDAENNDVPDKITIKVKVIGEDYHDVLIDWSDGQDVSRQLYKQLASITGIPPHKIDNIVIEEDLGQSIMNPYRNGRRQGPTENDYLGLERLNHGACYVVTLYFSHFARAFHVNLFLLPSTKFDEKQCATWCCQHIDGRTFLNRRVELIKKGGSIFHETRDNFRGDSDSTFSSMNILPYLAPRCSVNNSYPHPYFYYSRTHG